MGIKLALTASVVKEMREREQDRFGGIRNTGLKGPGREGAWPFSKPQQNSC
jgi:hypothetical protein